MAYLLIVDDDRDFAEAAGTVLRSEGYEIDIETDSEKALDRIEQRRPDAVILDVVFPENDRAGFDVANAVRRTFGDLPVLLLTSVQQHFPREHRHRTPDRRELPAAEFMEKPIDFKTLSKKIAQILAAHPTGA
jgi:CheY-like chemotaxis protein